MYGRCEIEPGRSNPSTEGLLVITVRDDAGYGRQRYGHPAEVSSGYDFGARDHIRN